MKSCLKTLKHEVIGVAFTSPRTQYNDARRERGQRVSHMHVITGTSYISFHES